MPNRCCVPACKSNYTSKTVSVEYVSVFKLPRNEERKKLRLQNNVESSKDMYSAAVEVWDQFVQAEVCEEFSFEVFVSEKLKLHKKSPNSRRYSPHLTTLAYSLYIKSAACYEELRQSQIIYLPSIRHLKRLTSFLSLSPSTNNVNNTVSLLLDEVHVKPAISYKGKALYGFAENAVNTEATSVQAFMVSSIFSTYKDIIGLVPVKNMSASDLTNFTKTALSVLHGSSFNVLTVISDNNRINRNMFQHLKLQAEDSVCIKNPVDNSRPLFLLFDSVHIVKSIRNNLLNQIDSEKTFVCPDFEDFTKIVNVKFSFLRKVFNIERNSIVKYAHKLSFKTTYPTNIERQNVNLALNIFDESTQAAIQIYGEQNCFSNWQPTVQFLKTVKKWWDIMNIKNTKKGFLKRNAASFPFRSLSDERFQFLGNFLAWLDAWKKLKLKPRCGCLSEETFYALTQTTRCMISLIEHLLNQGNSYVLTGKFQTDCLESRFGIYRQMSGSNYHVSVIDVIESERKLRIKSILTLNSSSLGNIFFRSLCGDDTSGDVEEVDICDFSDVLCDFNVDVSCDEVEILTYISGYCVFKLNLTCSMCLKHYVVNHNILIEPSEIHLAPISENKPDSFINIVNRGGLKKPSRLILNIIIHAYSIFKKLLTSEFEENFQKCNMPQHKVLVNLIKFYLENSDLFSLQEKCDIC
nr:uncharacterized protein LOC122272083 [Parasteatoda tepidariorum]